MTSALAVIVADAHHPFHITPMGLQPMREKVSFEVWEEFGLRLRQLEQAIQWNLGDWIIWGETHYGEEFAQAVDHMHWNIRTIMNYTRVCEAFPLARRTHHLSFSHYQCVMGLGVKQQEFLLKQAVDESWNRTVLREKVRTLKGHVPRGKMDIYTLHSELKDRSRLVEQLMILRTNHLIKSFERTQEAYYA